MIKSILFRLLFLPLYVSLVIPLIVYIITISISGLFFIISRDITTKDLFESIKTFTIRLFTVLDV